ncbi:hypothetical protein SGPA1_10883 [Streptomyces misionensis JCM 4497]
MPSGSLHGPLRRGPEGAGPRPVAASGADRPGGDRPARPGLCGGAARLPEVAAAVGVHGDVRARQLAASAGQHAVPADLRQQRRGPDGPHPLPPLLRGLRLRGGIRLRAAQRGLGRSADRCVRRDRRGARRLHRAVAEGAGLGAGAVPDLPAAAAACLAGAGLLVRAPGRVFVRAGGLGRRDGGVRRPCDRLPGGSADRPAAQGRHPAPAAAARHPLRRQGAAAAGLVGAPGSGADRPEPARADAPGPGRSFPA